MQEQIRQAAEAAQRAKEEKAKTGRRNKTYSEVKKDMDQKKRQKEKVRIIIHSKYKDISIARQSPLSFIQEKAVSSMK